MHAFVNRDSEARIADCPRPSMPRAGTYDAALLRDLGQKAAEAKRRKLRKHFDSEEVHVSCRRRPA